MSCCNQASRELFRRAGRRHSRLRDIEYQCWVRLTVLEPRSAAWSCVPRVETMRLQLLEAHSHGEDRNFRELAN